MLVLVLAPGVCNITAGADTVGVAMLGVLDPQCWEETGAPVPALVERAAADTLNVLRVGRRLLPVAWLGRLRGEWCRWELSCYGCDKERMARGILARILGERVAEIVLVFESRTICEVVDGAPVAHFNFQPEPCHSRGHLILQYENRQTVRVWTAEAVFSEGRAQIGEWCEFPLAPALSRGRLAKFFLKAHDAIRSN